MKQWGSFPSHHSLYKLLLLSIFENHSATNKITAMKKHLNTILLPMFLLLTVSAMAQEYGFASYYSDRYQGRRTAYGDIYDKNKMTCSHKKHPYGTLLKVTRLDNNKSVVCKVIDKGPYTKGRIVDLSRAAAEEIDLIQEGVARVRVEVYRRDDTPVAQQERRREPAEPPAEYEAPSPSRSTQEPNPSTRPSRSAEESTTRTRESQSREPAARTERSAPAEKPAVKSDPNKLVGQDYKKYGLYKIQLQRGPQGGFGVQVMVVSDSESVMRAISSLQERGFTNILVSVEQGQNQQTLYKIILGPFNTRPQAENYQGNLRERYNISGFIVDLAEKSNPSSNGSTTN
jgi:rare lipoprotein A